MLGLFKPVSFESVTMRENKIYGCSTVTNQNVHNCFGRISESLTSIFFLDSNGDHGPYILIQYYFQGKEHELKFVKPHGNSKKGKEYIRLFPSVRDKFKASSDNNKKEKPSVILDAAYLSAGDVSEARSLGQLPRGPTDVYNARRAAQKKSKETGTNEDLHDHSRNRSDGLWSVLERAKREKASGKNAFIRECSVHPELFIVLADNRQLDELAQFCTNPKEFCIYGIDPTFNIFKESISLTVTTYRNLRLTKRDTGKPPVFIGPLLMHQSKDWKTYSKFAHRLVLENPSLESVLACGTDGEKAIFDRFQKKF